MQHLRLRKVCAFLLAFQLYTHQKVFFLKSIFKSTVIALGFAT